MTIALIAAMAENHVIGHHNKLPWHMPADLKHFKALTLHKKILMGRKTFESIGKPLPQRDNVILTRDKSFNAEGCHVIHSLEEALSYDDLMVIGGAEIYTMFLSKADILYLTIIHEKITGDAFFPVFSQKDWQEVSREKHEKDTNNPYDYSFVTFKRMAI